MIPAIPSDSMYKAATYTGAFLTVACLLGPMVLQDRFDAAQVNYLKDLNASNVSLYVAMPSSADKSDSAAARRSDLLRLVEQNHESHRNFLQQAVAMKGRVDAAANTFMFGGCLLFVVGLTLWWKRVQWYQDEMLKAEYAKSKTQP